METGNWGYLYSERANSFDPTYKGWKRNNSTSWISGTVKLWSYLQGMETINRNWGKDFLCVALILPTRDGNRKTSKKMGRVRSALILPTRDGNPSAACSPRDRPRALILPTRDGNVSPSVSSPSQPPCFDPTYKGWKLGSVLWIIIVFVALILPTRDGNMILCLLKI